MACDNWQCDTLMHEHLRHNFQWIHVRICGSFAERGVCGATAACNIMCTLNLSAFMKRVGVAPAKIRAFRTHTVAHYNEFFCSIFMSNVHMTQLKQMQIWNNWNADLFTLCAQCPVWQKDRQSFICSTENLFETFLCGVCRVPRRNQKWTALQCTGKIQCECSYVFVNEQ